METYDWQKMIIYRNFALQIAKINSPFISEKQEILKPSSDIVDWLIS